MKKKHKLFLTLLLFSLPLIFFLLSKDKGINPKLTSVKTKKAYKIALKEKAPFKKLKAVNNNAQLKVKIQTHLNLSHSLGEDAEKNYQASLKELKKDKDINTGFLIQEYEYAMEGNYEKRQIIVETIRELKSSLSISFFSGLIESDFPEEKSKDRHHGSTQLEEGIIRLTAIEGLGHFLNNVEVKNILFNLVNKNESPLPLKRQAVRELLLIEKDPQIKNKLTQELKDILPVEEHFIVTDRVDSPPTIPIPKQQVVLSDEEYDPHHGHSH